MISRGGWRARVRSFGLAAVLGAAVGVLAAIYLRSITALTRLLWGRDEPWFGIDGGLYTIAVCALGGLLVGLIRARHDADTPHDLDDTLAHLDTTLAHDDGPSEAAPPRPRWLLRAGLLGVVSLGFGASLGPEAPLLALATGFGQRMARILRVSQAEAAYVSAAGALSGMFGGPLGSVVLPIEGSERAKRSSMLGLGLVASLSGLVALLVVLPDEARHRYELPETTLTTGTDLLQALGWSTMAAALGAAAGLCLVVATAPARRLAERTVRSPVLRGLVGGTVLGVCGALAPLSIFSGHEAGFEVLGLVAESSVLGLLALALVKLVATLACLATGWFGGQVFPALFAGMTAALAIVVIFPAAPIGPVAAAGAAAAATAVLRRPLASVLLLVFFFPISAVTSLALGAAVATVAVRVLGDRVPPAPAMNAH